MMISDLVMAAALLLGDPPPVSAAPEPWGEFSRFPARGQSRVTVSIGTVHRPAGGSVIYWASRRGIVEGGSTDSVRCPALTSVVDSMGDIELPTLTPAAPRMLIGDGTLYSISLPSSYHPPHASNLDRITVTSGGGPLAEWIDHALSSLEECWQRP